jgi:WD40 repeat protein
MTGQVFISYSHVDRSYVDSLAAQIVAAGLPLWYDYEIATGDRFEKVIKQQIDACSAFVVVMTDASDQSEWVSIEVNYAKQRGKPVLPLLLDGEVFMRLNILDYADVRGGRLPDQTFFDQLKRLVGPAEPMTQPAPSPQVTGAPVIVATEPGELIRTMTVKAYHPSGVEQMEHSPDGQLLAIGGANGLSVWNPSSGNPVSRPAKDAVTSMTWLPDGVSILATVGGVVKRLHATSGARTKLLDTPATGAAMSLDLRQIATADLPRSLVETWYTATGTLRLTFFERDVYYHSVALSPDGRRLAAAGVRCVTVPGTYALGWAPQVDIWSTANGTKAASVLQARPDQRTQGGLLPPMALRPRWDERVVTSMVFAADGRHLVIHAREPKGIRLRWISTQDWQTVSDLAFRGTSAALSADWRRVATTAKDRAARVWDISNATQPLFMLSGHGGTVTCLAFAPDGRTLVTTCDDGIARIWQI